MLLPALIATPLRQIAEQTAAAMDAPASTARVEQHLGALAGRQLGSGGWTAGARRAQGEVLVTGRDRPYDESTLRQAARTMTAAGAVAIAERALQQQVHRAVGGVAVTAFTDMFDQVYWTQKRSWAAPVGALGNRLLACTYFGLTFVRTADGPLLAYGLSWHKPASPLLDALQALHGDAVRPRWLTAHVTLHVLDRGTQGDPALRWALAHGIPYLTLTNGTAQWRRFANPTHTTASGVPVFVRRDGRLRDAQSGVGCVTAPRVIVFPARPDAGEANGRALRYRTCAVLSDGQIEALDATYKARWPGNENPIKALVAVGFDRNLDRTLDSTTSRGHDGQMQRQRARIAALEDEMAALLPRPIGEVGKRFASLHARRERAAAKLATLDAAAVEQGARSDRGGEHLCKLLALLLFNALALLLWRSPIDAVRVMTPARVRDLLLGRTATVSCEAGRLCLQLDALHEPTDRAHQEELVRLFNTARLQTRGLRLSLKLRDPPAILQALRIAA